MYSIYRTLEGEKHAVIANNFDDIIEKLEWFGVNRSTLELLDFITIYNETESKELDMEYVKSLLTTYFYHVEQIEALKQKI